METEQIRNPVKAIRAFCLDCVGNSPNEVKLCPSERCALYPFRFGKNPYTAKRKLTEEQKHAVAARLAAYRLGRKSNED